MILSLASHVVISSIWSLVISLDHQHYNTLCLGREVAAEDQPRLQERDVHLSEEHREQSGLSARLEGAPDIGRVQIRAGS